MVVSGGRVHATISCTAEQSDPAMPGRGRQADRGGSARTVVRQHGREIVILVEAVEQDDIAARQTVGPR